MKDNLFEDKLKTQLIKELENVDKYSEDVLDYMKDKDNWFFVDPDGAIGGSFLSYPMEVLALSTRKMTKKIMEELNIEEPKLIEEELTEEENLEYLKMEEEGVDLEDIVANGFSAIFAGFYWEDENGDPFSTLEIEMKEDGVVSTCDIEDTMVFSNLVVDVDKGIDFELLEEIEIKEDIGEANFVFIFNGYEVDEENLEKAECLNSDDYIDYIN